jgi:hypothetical protein
MEIFTLLSSVPYLGEILQIVLAGHAVALAIVNMTDTPKDNEMVATVYKYIEFAAGIVKPSKVKQPLPWENITKKSP